MKDPSEWAANNPEYSNKHAQQRVVNGFSVYDWWNFDEYLRWVIARGLRKFRHEGSGHPGQLSEDEWNDILDQMIEGFEAVPEVEEAEGTLGQYYERSAAAREKEQAALKLFAQWFEHLWD